MRKWLLLLGAITTEVSGSLSLKGAIDHPWLYGVVAIGFTSAFVFLSYALRDGMPLGVAYGVWGATGVAATATLSSVFFDEALTPLMIAGIALIIIGVLTIEFGSQAAARRDRSMT